MLAAFQEQIVTSFPTQLLQQIQFLIESPRTPLQSRLEQLL
jgi:hypothetical protein